MGESIRRPQRNDAQGSVTADHTLQDIVRGAVAATGENSVKTLDNGLARLFARFRLSACRFGDGFDSSLMQHRQSCLNVCQPPLSARPRERVVEEKGLAHQE